MNKLYFLIFSLLFCTGILTGQVAINNTGALPNVSSQLDLAAIDKGLLIPRMSSLARNAISAPANGLFVYDTDTKSQWFYSTQFSRWLQIIDSVKDMWALNTDVVYNKSAATIGIGTTTPSSTLSLFNTTAPSLRFTNAATGNGSTNGTVMNYIIDELSIKNNETGNTNFITDAGIRMAINGASGHVSIGGEPPTSPLSFNRVVGEKINIGNVSATESFGIGVAPATLQIHSASSSGEIQFGIGKSGTGFTELLSIDVPFSNLKMTNKMTRQSATAIANILPVAYGRVNANGTIANSGTGNFSIIRSSGGVYQVRLADPQFESRHDLFTIIISPYNFVPTYNGANGSSGSRSTVYHNIDYSGSDIFVRMYEYVVLSAAVICSQCIGNLASTILNTYALSDSGFSFWVYKAE